MDMKSSFIQLCVDASTWSMVAIPEFGCIRIKGRLSGFVIGIRHEGRRNFEDQRTNVHKELCTLLVD